MKVNILEIPIDNVSLEEALAQIHDMLLKPGPRYVCTVNLDYLRLSQKDPAFKKFLQKAPLVLADGMPLVWLSQAAGMPLKERVAGVDLAQLLLEDLSIRKKKVFFLGPSREVAEKVAATYASKGLIITGISCPTIESNGESAPLLIEQINQSKPDILFISLGAPKQEHWFLNYQKDLKVPVSIGIGGSLNFLAGVTKRAPKGMQKTGFEWAFRLWQEPLRLGKRYFLDAIFFLFRAFPSSILKRFH